MEKVDSYSVDFDGIAFEAQDGKLNWEERKVGVRFGSDRFQPFPGKVKSEGPCLLAILNSDLGSCEGKGGGGIGGGLRED